MGQSLYHTEFKCFMAVMPLYCPAEFWVAPCHRSGGWDTKCPGDHPGWGRRTLHSQHAALLSALPQTAASWDMPSVSKLSRLVVFLLY